jgi:hypothetical protein
MGDPGINPSHRIDGIRTIRGDLVANEEILRNRFLRPFFKPTLFFDRPPAIADFPDLIRGFIQRLTEARRGDKDYEKENDKKHGCILKRIREDCQQNRLRPLKKILFALLAVSSFHHQWHFLESGKEASNW